MLEHGTLSLSGIALVQFEGKLAQSLEDRLRIIMRKCGKNLGIALQYGDIDLAAQSIRMTNYAFSQLSFLKRNPSFSQETTNSFVNQVESRIDEFWNELLGRLKEGQIYESAWLLSDLILLVRRACYQIQQRIDNVEFCSN